MKTSLVTLLLSLSISLANSAGVAGVFDVTKYGAIADGKHMNTEAFRKAIEAAEAAGGGTVHFPKGEHHYLTGPIHLKSHVDLELAEGTVVKFSDNFDDYLPMVKIRRSGNDIMNFSPLIYGWHVEHVTVKGKGTFDGSGKKWWDFFWTLRHAHERTGVWPTDSKWHKDFLDANAELIKSHPSLKQPGFYRPPLFHPIYSNHITVIDVTFKDSPWFVVTPWVCDNVLLDGVKVINPGEGAPNTDGIHPDSCRNITVRNCFVSTGDDGIVFTSGTDATGKRHTENVTVHDCVVHEGHGGIVIGSGISGDVRNFHAHHLHFEGTQRGIRVKTIRDHGGILEDVRFEHITMKNISHEGITINAAYTNVTSRAFDDKTPILRNIHIHNVTGDSALGIQIVGLPEKHFDQIELKDVTMTAKHTMVEQYVDHLVKSNLTYHVDKHLYEKH